MDQYSVEFLRLLLVLGLIQSGSGIYCFSCVSPMQFASERCSYFALCPEDSIGCLTIEFEENSERNIIKGCSFVETCSDGGLYKKKNDPRGISCSLCNQDLCNSAKSWPMFSITVLVYLILQSRIII